MKTLQLGTSWFLEEAGGLARVYYGCVNYLPQVGVGVSGLVAGSDRVEQSSRGLVQTFASTNSGTLQRSLGVRKAFKQVISNSQFDLVASHFALYTFPILDRLGKLPLVIHFHGPWSLESKAEGAGKLSVFGKWAIEKLVYGRADGFIVLSEAFRQILHKTYGVPLEKIFIVGGGIDTAEFKVDLTIAEARERLGWAQDRRIILCVRRLVQRMGLDNLIAAIAQVRQQYPEVLLLIAGKGAIAESLRSQIQQLQLEDSVKLLGFVDDRNLPIAYRAAELSIIPSVSLEGFGLIAIESLAAGTPVLGTPIGGIPEILRLFSTDLILEGSTTSQLAQGIIEALSGQRQMPKSEACQDYVRQNYDWQVIAQQMKSVYDQVLQR
ncbi:MULTISPECIES: glycosyltransferase family 4 protein [Pseudanabaena]|uniref:Glycosyl transferase group 1 n=2 Tax=Pseudanabaena TaxID=1152 RepID=L8MWH9_9CYAN|nr:MULTISPECIES: glycosyltransferase family 4 protein [Pseudanabaena]ELS31836.1 glycosyl transferase group 1 [Pseudanabaena biceps PCC 7429]MDG3495916.1 glycosyltransferase family 4 protein [Pseudanabaena catenata USMAC16]